MEPIRIEEILGAAIYERLRRDLRRRVIEARSRRRIRLGEAGSIVFETRETILYQLKETLRAERILDPEEIAREIDAANEQLPPPLCLVGILYLEGADPARSGEAAARLSGPGSGDRIGFDLGDGLEAPGRILGQGEAGGRLAAAHRLRFPFTAPAAERFRDLEAPAAIVLDAGELRVRSPVEGEVRRLLRDDLSGSG